MNNQTGLRIFPRRGFFEKHYPETSRLYDDLLDDAEDIAEENPTEEND